MPVGGLRSRLFVGPTLAEDPEGPHGRRRDVEVKPLAWRQRSLGTGGLVFGGPLSEVGKWMFANKKRHRIESNKNEQQYASSRSSTRKKISPHPFDRQAQHEPGPQRHRHRQIFCKVFAKKTSIFSK